MGERFLVDYDGIAVLGFASLILVLIFGGIKMRQRAAKRENSRVGARQRGGALFLAIGLVSALFCPA